MAIHSLEAFLYNPESSQLIIWDFISVIDNEDYLSHSYPLWYLVAAWKNTFQTSVIEDAASLSALDTSRKKCSWYTCFAGRIRVFQIFVQAPSTCTLNAGAS